MASKGETIPQPAAALLLLALGVAALGRPAAASTFVRERLSHPAPRNAP